MSETYRDVLASLPLPTLRQTQSFVNYVASAHSWYKHLPLFPPGQRFIFFLDPNAGRVTHYTPGGEVAFLDITDKDDLFHHSSMLTAAYRQRFGYWNYFNTGSVAPHIDPLLYGRSAIRPHPSVMGEEGSWLTIPTALARAGTCRLTALIHHRFMPFLRSDHQAEDIERYELALQRHPDRPFVQRYRPLLELLTLDVGPSTEAYQAWRRKLLAFHQAERVELLRTMEQTMQNVVEQIRAQTVGA